MTLDDLLTKWLGKEGAGERAEYQQFLTEFCQALDLPTPGDPGQAVADYRFEAPVKSEAALGRKGTGRIDLYKRDCFILEAKQSQLKPGETPPVEPAAPMAETVYDLFGNAVGTVAAKPGKGIAPRYDRLMTDARLQAERYALALPQDHRTPPFLIVADIGRSFELYFDWAGNGRGYAPFHDERGYRVPLEGLRDDEVRARFRAIWLAPASIDPRLKAAEVTRAVAERLSRVAQHLEGTQRQLNPGRGDAELALGIEQTALFVMRLLFCMFAEDTGLLPKDKFTQFLTEARDLAKAGSPGADAFWRTGLADLWAKLDAPDRDARFWLLGQDFVPYVNGNLFRDSAIYPLPAEFKGELVVAAGKEWKNVEPAIFGTLLEQVLTPGERAKLGAHYTPRAYVERLVEATMAEPLRADWDAARSRAAALVEAGDVAGAVAAVQAFHAQLADTRVLDPACGTGNFLYVALEQLLRLEGEVRQLAAGLGALLPPAVHPNQMLGLELNPRAAVIAELVLWIGWLRYRLANTPEAIGEPVLPTLTNINFGRHGGYDAVLARTATGDPDVADPRRPDWPAADFIVGNPPFIGGKNIRGALNADHPGYAEALWRANPAVPASADFVMQWWERAAAILTAPDTRLRRFGFVTTNSITQVFSRRVIERYLASGDADEEAAAGKLHLLLAIPDHPWTRVGKDAAAVRIAMTVAAAGASTGRVVTITSEAGLDTDAPLLGESIGYGAINANLSCGSSSTSVVSLVANEGLCSRGVGLHGAGFLVAGSQVTALGLSQRTGLEAHIRPYRNGRDMLQRSRNLMVIDLYGLDENEVMDRFPEVYQHLIASVKPERDKNRRATRRDRWWLFGESAPLFREYSANLKTYISTTETAKHRVFTRLSSDVLPDNSLVNIGSDDPVVLGVLSSTFHASWVIERGGWLGVGNDSRYSKSLVFDPFPFPAATDPQRTAIAALGERLDKVRRDALAENAKLTMTELYNLVAEVRGGAVLSAAREREATVARARIVAKLHDDLDQAVADAYGWGEEWRQAPLPPAEIVVRLVRLNAERAAEEKAGLVRWLRPDYQIPRFATAAESAAD